MSKLLDKNRQYCNRNFHDASCKCYKLAEQEFLEMAKKSSYWDSIETDINFEGAK